MITLNEQELNMIVTYLVERPYKEVAHIIGLIQEKLRTAQVQEQQITENDERVGKSGD